MTTITASLRRALRLVTDTPDTQMHFHVGADGRPFVCDVARCDSPGLTLTEASRAQASAQQASGPDVLAA